MKKLFNSSNIGSTLISLAFLVLTVVLAVYMANQTTVGENNEVVKQHTRQIYELKECSKEKVDKQLYDYSLQQLDKRLTNIEKSQEEIKIILITNK